MAITLKSKKDLSNIFIFQVIIMNQPSYSKVIIKTISHPNPEKAMDTLVQLVLKELLLQRVVGQEETKDNFN